MSTDKRSEELLDELRRLADAVDPVPEEVTAYAKSALGWRRIDAELAELLTDSAVDAGTPALARSSPGQARSVTFGADDLEIDLSIQEAETGLVLLGQLAPPSSPRIELQRDDGSIAATVEADDLGRFRVEVDAGGRLRLLVSREPPSPPIETSWIGI